MTEKSVDANYSSLENNDNAQNYFDNSNSKTFIAYEKLIPYVTEKLLYYNNHLEGNPYTGQGKLGARKFIINKSRILSHR